ncbi:MAG TPA: phosphate signaling complex protein PhoU [Azospirillaceae bacterium]|nr:phosphate signaling complex protein PhoU [Azospirillaceae bacterium]
MQSGHIVSSYDQELARLRQVIADMGALALGQLEQSVAAAVARDGDLATSIMKRDGELDAMERQIEALTLRMLALRQPMARDLREIVAALKISANLERIGDFAANLAKRSLALNTLPETSHGEAFARLGGQVAGLLRDAMAANAADDLDAALSVRERDEAVDQAHTELHRALLADMTAHPALIIAGTHLMFAAKNLERIGDHATNIAEIVCFKVKGHAPGEERHKDDGSSFAVLD